VGSGVSWVIHCSVNGPSVRLPLQVYSASKSWALVSHNDGMAFFSEDAKQIMAINNDYTDGKRFMRIGLRVCLKTAERCSVRKKRRIGVSICGGGFNVW